MMQLYFLSVLCNGLMGSLLLAKSYEEDSSAEGSPCCPLVLMFNNLTFVLVLSVLSIATGFIKLFAPFTGEGRSSIPILGDLLPVAGGIIGGFALLFWVYRQKTSGPVDTTNKLDRLGGILVNNKKILGAGLLAIAVFHFLFPGVLFL